MGKISLFFSDFLNKYLRYVLNIALKSNNPTIKLFFVRKDGTKMTGFAVVKKAPSHRKKIFFE